MDLVLKKIQVYNLDRGFEKRLCSGDGFKFRFGSEKKYKLIIWGGVFKIVTYFQVLTDFAVSV